MKQTKEITKIYQNYPLGMHIDVQMQLYGLIHPVAPEKILLDASDIPTWKTNLDLEKDVVSESNASEVTKELSATDKKRDEALYYIFQEVLLAAKSPIESRRKVGHRLHLITKAYKDIRKERRSDRTGHVMGLLNDLDKPAVAADVAALGMTDVVNLLRTLNNEYIRLRDERLKAETATHLPSGAEIREKNDQTVTLIFRHIQAAYIVAASEDDRKMIGELIDRINKILLTAKSSYRQSVSLKKTAAEKKKKEGEDDKQPKQPKGPKTKPEEGKKPEDGKTPDPKPTPVPQPNPKPKPKEGDDDGDDVYIPAN